MNPSHNQLRRLSRISSGVAMLLIAATAVAEPTPPAPRNTAVVRITNPANGGTVNLRQLIQGTVQEPGRMRVYVLIHPRKGGPWWVQPLPSPPNADGSWQLKAYFGDEEHGEGEEFEIIAIASAETNLLNEGDQLSMKALQNLREKYAASDIVVVKRQ